jgi:phosphatidate cytidylyltransferase
MRLLSSRLLTGVCAFAAFVLFGLMAQDVVAWTFFLIVLFLAGMEWGGLSGLQSICGKTVYSLSVCVLSVVALDLITVAEVNRQLAADSALVLWLAAVFWLGLYQKTGKGITTNKIILATVGALVLVSMAVSVMTIKSSNLYFLLSLVLVVSCADISAFVGGKLFGRHKLMPNVSPGKTWEGLIFGILGAMLIGNLIYLVNPVPNLYIWNAVVAITTLAAVVGDLFESMIKRFRKVKNSGTVLPGHGGVLDRLDSLCAASPVYLCALIHAGYIA